MVKVSCLCSVDVLLKLGKVRFEVRFRRDTLVDGVIDLGREALGEFTLDAGTLEGAGQGQPVGHHPSIVTEPCLAALSSAHLDDLGIRQTNRRLLDLPLGDKLIEPFYIAADGCVVVESFTTQRDVNAPSTLGLQTNATLLFMLAKVLAAMPAAQACPRITIGHEVECIPEHSPEPPPPPRAPVGQQRDETPTRS